MLTLILRLNLRPLAYLRLHPVAMDVPVPVKMRPALILILILALMSPDRFMALEQESPDIIPRCR